MAAEIQIVFPRSLKDIYPVEAQQLYIKAYQESLAITSVATQERLSRDSVASRDAWNAVWREYTQDDVSHKWYRNGEKPIAVAKSGKRSVLGTIKDIFKR